MSPITIGELKEPGRLQKGDTLHSSVTGWHTVAYIKPDGKVCVKNEAGEYFTWSIDWPDGMRVQ